MEANKILSADILDILFDGKNKEYGAYELRKGYNTRAAIALGLTGLVIIIFLCSFISFKNSSKKISHVIDISSPAKPPEAPKALPKKNISPSTAKAKTIANPPPKIVVDILVKNPPPENKDFVDARIGLKTTDGRIDDSPAPIETKGSSAVEAPHPATTEIDNRFIPIEIEASFKGDWVSYVRKEIEKHLDELAEAGESGTCMVKFFVAKDGTVSNVEATTMKGTKLAEIAVNAIRRGPKWIPAMQNGQPVNAYRMQPVSFQLQDQ